jgi:hypothetical protein
LAWKELGANRLDCGANLGELMDRQVAQRDNRCGEAWE